MYLNNFTLYCNFIISVVWGEVQSDPQNDVADARPALEGRPFRRHAGLYHRQNQKGKISFRLFKITK